MALKTLRTRDLHGKDTTPFDVATHLGPSWQGTALDVLALTTVSASDKIWAISPHLPDDVARNFGIWCAEQARDNSGDTDPDAAEAIRTAKGFLEGTVDAAEMEVARAKAEAAYRRAGSQAKKNARRAAAKAGEAQAKMTPMAAAYMCERPDPITHGVRWQQAIDELTAQLEAIA